MKQPNKTILLSACNQGSGHKMNLLIVEEWLKRNGYNPVWRTSENQPELIYDNGKLSFIKSLRANIAGIKDSAASLFIQRETIRSYQPLAVITDFEPVLAQAAAQQGVLSINISSQPIYFEVNPPNLPGPWGFFYRWLYEIKLRGSIAWSHHNLTPSFIRPYVINKRDVKKFKTFGPLIRDSLKPHNRQAIPSLWGHDVVAVHVTKQLPNLKRLILDYLPEGTRLANSQVHFDTLLENCDYVITTGGHNLLAECVYLQKPALIFPIPNHYEQYFNAEAFCARGFGMIGDVEDIAESIYNFKLNLASYRNALKDHYVKALDYDLIGNQSLFADLSKLLSEEEQKKLSEV